MITDIQIIEITVTALIVAGIILYYNHKSYVECMDEIKREMNKK